VEVQDAGVLKRTALGRNHLLRGNARVADAAGTLASRVMVDLAEGFPDVIDSLRRNLEIKE